MLSKSLDTDFCLEALDMALSSCHRLQIFHFDQGCQFIATDFVARFHGEDIKINLS